MAEQQVQIAKELEKRELDEFEAEFSNLLKQESNTARKDLKNVFLMNQRGQQQMHIPLNEIKKKLPETLDALMTNLPDAPAPQKGIIGFGQIPIIAPSGTIPFALLSRKNNRTKIDKIELPSNNSIVIQTRARIQEEVTARNEIKEQTLQRMDQEDSPEKIE